MSKRGHPEEQIPRALHRRLQGVPRGQMRIISRRSVVMPSEKWRDKSTFSSWVLSPTGFRIPPSPPCQQKSSSVIGKSSVFRDLAVFVSSAGVSQVPLLPSNRHFFRAKFELNVTDLQARVPQVGEACAINCACPESLSGGCSSSTSVVSLRRYRSLSRRRNKLKARLKYPERERKAIGIGVIRTKD